MEMKLKNAGIAVLITDKTDQIKWHKKRQRRSLYNT